MLVGAAALHRLVCVCVRVRASGLVPELFEEVDISRGGDELDEVLVGGSVGVGFLLLLRLLLPLLQLRQQHPVDGVRVAENLHQGLQHWRHRASSSVSPLPSQLYSYRSGAWPLASSVVRTL